MENLNQKTNLGPPIDKINSVKLKKKSINKNASGKYILL